MGPAMPDGHAVITGLGLVLPQGVGIQAAEAVFDGRSAVRFLPEIVGVPEATGAKVVGFTPPCGTEQADRSVQFAVAAAEEAWTSAGLPDVAPPPDRIAVLLGSSKGGLDTLSRLARGEGRPEPVIPAAGPDAAAYTVAARLGTTGPMGAPLSACASGGHAMVWGATLIARGVVDVAIVGAADASLIPLVMGSYRRMGVLAAAGEDPATSVRPFSATRRGFAIGEGAGAIVLESPASAARRAAPLLAQVRGWACGSHATSLTDIEADGHAMAYLMREAMRRAGIRPADVDYINAHGTATRANDLAEARAIHEAMGDAAAHVGVSSTKGAHGHLLGAATAVELVLAVLAIRRGVIPATANLTDPDPAIGLDCTPLRPRERRIRHALKVASGFGGQMMAVVLSATESQAASTG